MKEEETVLRPLPKTRRSRGVARRALYRVARSAMAIAQCCIFSGLIGGGVASAATFEFPSQNATYVDVSTDSIPVQTGLAKLVITSPSHTLTLVEHSLELLPTEDGAHRADLRVTFQGQGQLVVDVDVAGAINTMTDEVVVPKQEKRLVGTLRIEPSEEGYLIEIVELPETLSIGFDSKLAASLVSTCQQVPLFALMGIECSTLSGFLSTADVPLPPAGSRFTLKAEELSVDSRSELDRYLKDPR